MNPPASERKPLPRVLNYSSSNPNTKLSPSATIPYHTRSSLDILTNCNLQLRKRGEKEEKPKSQRSNQQKNGCIAARVAYQTSGDGAGDEGFAEPEEAEAARVEGRATAAAAKAAIAAVAATEGSPVN